MVEKDNTEYQSYLAEKYTMYFEQLKQTCKSDAECSKHLDSLLNLCKEILHITYKRVVLDHYYDVFLKAVKDLEQKVIEMTQIAPDSSKMSFFFSRKKSLKEMLNEFKDFIQDSIKKIEAREDKAKKFKAEEINHQISFHQRKLSHGFSSKESARKKRIQAKFGIESEDKIETHVNATKTYKRIFKQAVSDAASAPDDGVDDTLLSIEINRAQGDIDALLEVYTGLIKRTGQKVESGQLKNEAILAMSKQEHVNLAASQLNQLQTQDMFDVFTTYYKQIILAIKKKDYALLYQFAQIIKVVAKYLTWELLAYLCSAEDQETLKKLQEVSDYQDTIFLEQWIEKQKKNQTNHPMRALVLDRAQLILTSTEKSLKQQLLDTLLDGLESSESEIDNLMQETVKSIKAQKTESKLLQYQLKGLGVILSGRQSKTA